MGPHSHRSVGAVIALLLMTACAGAPGASASHASASGSPAPPAEPLFAFPAGDVATVSRELAGHPEESYINPGAVLVDDAGTFHMFANAFTAWPGTVQFPHLTSTDGVTWTHAAEPTPLSSAAVPFAQPGADVSSAFVTEDGTWTLVFNTVNFTSAWEIGRATAPGPDGPWTIDPEPIVTAGATGAWDGGGVAWPSVVQTDDGWAMYYSTGSRPRTPAGAIGMATSTDGIRWTKRAEPVLEPSAAWDGGALDRPRVQRVDGAWLMVYTGRTLNDRGLAWSDDGLAWTPDPANPVLGEDDFPVTGRMWDTALLWHDGVLRYYVEIGGATAQQTTDIYLATHEGAPERP